MSLKNGEAQTVNLDDVYLNQENPRHKLLDDQDAIIQYLCSDEQVFALAQDISTFGLNPLEMCALLLEGDNTYRVAEGNRRVCALKLLNDPSLAPEDKRKDFERLAENWNPVNQISAIVFDQQEDVSLWLDRIHAGIADGRGRRPWNAEQKARNSGYTYNDRAQSLLDVAQSMELIDPLERKGRISTVQRYISNPEMREVLGLDFGEITNPTTDLPEDEFQTILKHFVDDVVARNVTTRDNASSIREYAKSLNNLEGITGERSNRRFVKTSEPVEPASVVVKPKSPKPLSRIPTSSRLRDALKDIGSYKLEKLYYSLCSVGLRSHTPLLCVGAWSFLETLTALHGRKNNDFYSYLGPSKLEKLGLGKKTNTNSMRQAVKRIAEFGNSTKHDTVSAGFNGEQLANDMVAIEPILLNLALQCVGKT